MKHWLTSLAILLGTAAFAAEVAPWESITELDDPVAVIELARAHGHSKNASAVEIEALREAAARRLSEIGGDESRAFLGELASMEPTATVTEMGCRAPYERVLHPFHLEAGRALREIEIREQGAAFSAALAARDFSFVGEVALADARTHSVDALAGLAGKLSASDAREVIQRVMHTAPESIPAGGSHVVASLYLALEEAPPPKAFERLDAAAALYLLTEAERWPAAEREALLAAGRQHPAVASMAAVLEGNSAGLPLAAYLEKDGANAVLVLSRDRSEGMTTQVEEVLLSSTNPSVLKGAIAVLMLQDTGGAREALRKFTTKEDSPEPLRLEVEAWLNR